VFDFNGKGQSERRDARAQRRDYIFGVSYIQGMRVS